MPTRRMTGPLILGGLLASLAPLWADGVTPGADEAEALSALKGQIVGRIIWESNRTESWQLYTMNADGTGARRLTSGPGDNTQAHISADGRQVLYTHTGPEDMPQAWVMRVDGTGGRMLAENAADAEWRRGGAAIQFLRRPDRTREFWETWELDLASGQERKLFPRDGVKYQPEVWGGLGNDDGSRVVIWSRNPRGTWVLSPDGTVQKRVHGGCEGQVSRDQQYAYGCFRAGHFVRFNLSDGEDMQDILIGEGPFGHIYFPRVSADAQWLVFGGCPPDQHDHDTSDYEVQIVRLVDWKASGTPVRLSFNTRTDRWPDLWLAPEGGRNPLPNGAYDVAGNRATNPPPVPRALVSFAADDAKPEFGGDWGLWPQQEGCRGEATFEAEDAEGGQGGSMRVKYTIAAEPRSFSLWLTSGNAPADLSAYDRLVLYAKGDVPSLTLVVKDNTADDPDAPQGIAECVVKGLKPNWQRFEVPFAVFKPREKGATLNWRAVNHLGIAMIAPQNAAGGTFWVDNLRAEAAP